MRESERALTLRWLLLLQRERRRYTLDKRHQCWRGGAITRPFAWQPRFYGCTLCGQYHFCAANARTCPTAPLDADTQELVCLFSGQCVGVDLVAGSWDEERRVDEAPSLEAYAATNQARLISRRRFGQKRTLYSNMRAPSVLHEGDEEDAEEDEDKRLVRTAQRVARTPVEETETMLVEGEVDDEEDGPVGTCAKEACPHSDYAFWSEHFGYLGPVEARTESHRAPKHETLRRPPPQAPKARDEIVAITRKLLAALLVGQMGRRTMQRAEQALLVDAMLGRIAPLMCRVAALAPALVEGGDAAVRAFCQAMLGHALAETCYAEDGLGHRFPIWHRDAWLAHLAGQGIQVRGVKQASTDRVHATLRGLRAALAPHQTAHGLWLRHFLSTDENGPVPEHVSRSAF